MTRRFPIIFRCFLLWKMFQPGGALKRPSNIPKKIACLMKKTPIGRLWP